jgi:hypothetical protein
MTTLINASTSAGLVQTADTSGNLSLQSGGTTILALTSAGAAVTGTLSASGATTLSTTLGVTGATTLSSTLSVNSTAPTMTLKRTNSTTSFGSINWTGSDNTVDLQLTTNNAVASSLLEINEGDGANNRFLMASGGVSTFKQQLNVIADISIGYPKSLAVLATGSVAAIVSKTDVYNYPNHSMWNAADANDNLWIYFIEGTGGTVRGSIDFNRAGTLTRYNTTSDATLKNLIGDAPQARSLDILSQTRLREYSWKSDETNKPQIGVIAQELYEVFPGAVSVGGELAGVDEDGNPTTKYHPWSVDKTAYQFHLVAGWQNHEAKIAALEARLAALEAK